METNWQRKVIALTGVSGSGKTSVANIFKELGAFVLEADQLARRVLNPDSIAYTEVIAKFGKDILTPDNIVDRKKLGHIVFSNPQLRQELEQITHPRIKELAQRIFTSAAENKNYPLLVYDVPLLFEAGLDQQGFKKILVVSAPLELCRSRIIKRDNLTPQEAQNRLESQIPIKEKEKNADIVIYNTGSLEQLREEVSKIFKKLT